MKQINKIIAIEAIEIKGSERNDFVFFAVLLTRNGKNIAIENKLMNARHEELDAWLTSNFSQKMQILLVVNSDKVIHKTIASANILSDVDKIKIVIPNANSDDFLIQSYSLSKDSYFTSLVRKSYIENLLSQLDNYQNFITCLSVGPSPVFSTYKLAFQSDASNVYHVNFLNYSFAFNEDELKEFSVTSYLQNTDSIVESFYFGQEKVDSSLIISYSYAVNYFVNPISASRVKYEMLSRNSDEYVFAKLGRIVVFSCFLVLFVTLLISAAFFTMYTGKYSALNERYEYNKQNWENAKSKRTEYQRQKRILDRNGLTENSRISFYADQVTADMPESVYLSKMEIHPVNTKALTDNIEFLIDRILIDGNCYSSIELNDWVNSLKKLSWVKSILIKEYKDNEDIGSFSIEIIKNGT